MSETESGYSSFSEASDNDVREAPAALEAQTEEPVVIEGEEPEAAVEASEPETEATETETDTEREAREAKLARDLREARRRERQLAADNQKLREARPETRDETIQREAAAMARQMAQQDAVSAKSNEIYRAGVAAYGRVEFDEAVQAMGSTFGQNYPVVIDTLVDLPDAQRLIQHLADNPDIMDEMASMSPHKIAAALTKEAMKVAAPKVKPKSQAPKPIRPVATRGAAEPELDPEKMSIEELAKMWDKRDFERRWR